MSTQRQVAGAVKAGDKIGGQWAAQRRPEGIAPAATLNDGDSGTIPSLAEAVPDAEERDRFVNSYVAAAMWTTDISDEDGEESRPMDDDYDIDALHPETRGKIEDDLAQFVTTNRALVDQYLAAGQTYDQLGHDFLLNRNRHGAGFWDRGLGELGTQLSRQSEAAGQMELYVGDDELIWS